MAGVEDKDNNLPFDTSALETSPLAMKMFLDALAEMIALAILEESAKATDEHAGARRATPAVP